MSTPPIFSIRPSRFKPSSQKENVEDNEGRTSGSAILPDGDDAVLAKAHDDGVTAMRRASTKGGDEEKREVYILLESTLYCDLAQSASLRFWPTSFGSFCPM